MTGSEPAVILSFYLRNSTPLVTTSVPTTDKVLWQASKQVHVMTCSAAVAGTGVLISITINDLRLVERRFNTLDEAVQWADTYLDDLLALGWVQAQDDDAA